MTHYLVRHRALNFDIFGVLFMTDFGKLQKVWTGGILTKIYEYLSVTNCIYDRDKFMQFAYRCFLKICLSLSNISYPFRT